MSKRVRSGSIDPSQRSYTSVTTVASTKSRKKYKTPAKVKFYRTPFPPQLFNQLRYADLKTFTFGAGFYAHNFRANGMYDPDQTGTGHQPLYYDELTAIYNHWTVLKAKIKITYIGNEDYDLILTLGTDDDGTGPSSIQAAMEREGVMVVSGNPNVSALKPLWCSADIKRIFGGNPQSDPNLQGNIGSDPSEITMFNLTMQDAAAGSGTGAFTVEIWYDVVWDEIKTKTAS